MSLCETGRAVRRECGGHYPVVVGLPPLFPTLGRPWSGFTGVCDLHACACISAVSGSCEAVRDRVSPSPSHPLAAGAASGVPFFRGGDAGESWVAILPAPCPLFRYPHRCPSVPRCPRAAGPTSTEAGQCRAGTGIMYLAGGAAALSHMSHMPSLTSCRVRPSLT